jgi:hypothetical protein
MPSKRRLGGILCDVDPSSHRACGLDPPRPAVFSSLLYLPAPAPDFFPLICRTSSTPIITSKSLHHTPTNTYASQTATNRHKSTTIDATRKEPRQGLQQKKISPLKKKKWQPQTKKKQNFFGLPASLCPLTCSL